MSRILFWGTAATAIGLLACGSPTPTPTDTGIQRDVPADMQAPDVQAPDVTVADTGVVQDTGSVPRAWPAK
jgi:hypothetical protein